MCRGNRTYIDYWGDVKIVATTPEAGARMRESGAIEKTERQIAAGKLISTLSGFHKKVDMEKIFYQQTEDHVSFYAPYGDRECVCATDWCKKHCYLKLKPFEKGVKEKIQSTNIKQFDIDYFPSIVKQFDAKYFTLFSSGSVEDLGKDVSDSWGRYLLKIVTENINKKFRFLIKDVYEGTFLKDHKYYIPSLPDNGVIVLSLDASSPEGVLIEALKNKNIKGISIVNHEDNKELIDLVKNKYFLPTYKIKKVINCESCKDKMLCFNQKGRFVLIHKYKKS